MNKRVTILIVSICIVIIIASLFVSIPKENWSVMPYVLSPLLLASLVAIVFSTIHIIKKTPEIVEKEDSLEETKDSLPKNTLEETSSEEGNNETKKAE